MTSNNYISNEEAQSCPFVSENTKQNHINNSKKEEIQKSELENKEFSKFSIETNKKRSCFFVEIKDDASYLNLISFYLVQFSYVCFFSFMDSTQPHLLDINEGLIHDLPSKDYEVQANFDLILYDNIYLIFFMYIFGAFHDIIGRKIICFIGFILIGLSFILYPLVGSVYPNLILVRLLFSNGICSVTTQPLLSDYVKHTSKGFCGGISAFLSGCGALFGVFVLMGMNNYLGMSYKNIYFITGGMSIFVAVFCLFGVKNMPSSVRRLNETKENKENLEESTMSKIKTRFFSIILKVKDGFSEIFHNPKLLIGVFTNLQARMNSVLTTLLLIMYIKHFITDTDKAKSRQGFLSGICSIIGMISAVLFGFIYEKSKMRVPLIINNLSIFIGILLLILIRDPNSNIMLIALALLYFGFYGLTTVGFIIVNKFVSCKSRGAVMGVNSWAGSIGIVFLILFGRFMFNEVDVVFPFVISCILSGFMLVVLFIPSISKGLDEDLTNEE